MNQWLLRMDNEFKIVVQFYYFKFHILNFLLNVIIYIKLVFFVMIGINFKSDFLEKVVDN
jgi:hypothetical protein